MADEESEEELHRCVTEFMIATCRRAETNRYAGDILRAQSTINVCYGIDLVSVFATGSSVEFYIDPIILCVGDIDMMDSFKDSVAIQAVQPHPSELPAYFYREIRVYEIEDSELPGYVYLRLSYMLKRRDDGRYVRDKDVGNWKLDHSPHSLHNFRQTVPVASLLNCHWTKSERIPNKSLMMEIFDDGCVIEKHGPASNSNVGLLFEYVCRRLSDIISVQEFVHVCDDVGLPLICQHDFVSCVRCLLWPTHAVDWPTRYREHGWPDSATIDTVVNNGCDIVQAVHPLCKHDEWMSGHLWRLSFSRAEVTLLNSWTQMQQIIYHMLRFTIKNQVISQLEREFPNVSKLSNYHIKTLMLWSCELKPQSRWSPESYVIKLCSALIHELADMVSDKRCLHHFLSNCNIADHFQDHVSTVTSNRLKTVGEPLVLLHWFVDNYIHECAEKYPEKVSVLFHDVQTSDALEKALNLHFVTASNQQNKTVSVMRQYANINWLAELHVLTMLHFASTSTVFHTCMIIPVISQLDKTREPKHNEGQYLHDYYVATASLHVAYNISIHFLTNDLLDFLCTLYEPCLSDIDYVFTVIIEPVITGVMMKAIHLAKTSASCRNSTEKLHVEMSKTILHHSLLKRGGSSDPTPIDCMTHILLALLYSNTGHYRTTIWHCNQVMSHACSRAARELDKIEAEYVTGIDAEIDSMLGLIVFYQHLLVNELKPGEQLNKRSNAQLEFTAELVTQYLLLRCSAIVEKGSEWSSVCVFQQTKYEQYLLQTKRLPVTDALLCMTIKLQMGNESFTSVVQRAAVDGRDSNSSTNTNTSSLVSALEQVALEKLVAVRHTTMSELKVSSISVTNKFEELYLYKCGLFDECQQLCRSNLDVYLRGVKRSNFYHILFPELLWLLDGDLVSLVGIIQLQCAHAGYPPIIISHFMYNLTTYMNCALISCPIVSLYLYVECQKQLHSHSLHEALRLIYIVHPKPSDEFDRVVVELIYRSLKLFIRARREGDSAAIRQWPVWTD